MEGMMDEVKETVIAARIRAPRAGAVAGILFSILLFISLVLIRLSVPASPEDPGTWLSHSVKPIRLALDLLPFAGIAFLWFMGVLRDRMGEHEDRFLATVFLGSGLLFLAMTFASSAATGGLLIAYEATPEKFMDSGTYTFARTLGYELANVYALRMAGVFMFSTCTLAIRIWIFPRWMALLGYALALFLLLSVGRLGWAPLVFPLWTLVVSVYVLFANFRTKPVQGRGVIAPIL
jgi:hypothetical protein